MDPEDKAKKIVAKYWTLIEEPIRPEGIVTVWFCYILGGWKTLMFINSYPNNYFEVTYNKQKEEIYLDHYKKVHNEAFPSDLFI
jgi:hypothetical protein